MKKGRYHAGMLRQWVRIQERVMVDDSFGGYDLSWRTLLEARASVEPLSQRERLTAQQLETPITHRVVMRYATVLRNGGPDLRLVLDMTRYFNIRGIIDVEERHRWMELTVEENVGQ